MCDPLHSEHAIDIHGEDGSILLPKFRSTLRVSRPNVGLFTIIQIVFETKDDKRKNRGDLQFSYKSLVAMEHVVSDGQVLEQLTNLQLSNIGTSHPPDLRAPLTKYVLKYSFKSSTGSKIGTDPEFEPLLDYLKIGKPLRIVYKTDKNFTSDLENAIRGVLEQSKTSPFGRYHLRGYPDFRPENMNNMSKLKGKTLPARNVFHGKDDYLTTLAGGIHLEQERVAEKFRHFCDREHRMVAVNIAGCGDREYLVFFPPLLKDDVKIQAGDKFKILFTGRENLDQAWTVTVSFAMSQTPEGYLTGYLKRPPVGESGATGETRYDDYLLEALPADQRDLTSRIFDKNYGTMVRVFIAVNSNLHSRRLACLQTMQEEAFSDSTTATIAEIFQGRISHDFPKGNIFESIDAEYDGDPEKLIPGFNAEQQMIFKLGRNAPGRMVPVQGPPGTGKSHVVTNIAIPYIMSKDRHTILVTTQTNVGTDNSAKLYNELIQNLRKQYPDNPQLKRAYVVRLNVNDVETQIYARRYNKRSKNIPRSATSHQPSQQEQDALDNLSIVRDIVTHYREHQQSVNGPDSCRKEVPDVSNCLGVRMLEIAGVLDTGPKSESLESYSDFRRHYDMWRREEKMGDMDLEEFWEEAASLRDYVLQNATIVCTTITNAGSDVVRNNLKGRTDLIIIDEMPRCLEADALLLFFGGINPCGYIMVGDPYQLGPYVESEEDENPLAAQMGISLQERLQENGIAFILLRVQHRADPRLSIDTSDIFYDSQLINHHSVLDREPARKLTEFNLQKFGQSTNKLLLNIPVIGKRSTSGTKQSIHFSRYNEDHVMYAINLAEELTTEFPTATIGVLTGYAAQYSRMLSARQSMKYRGGPYEMISVHKIDTVQGLEFDYVILDMLLLDRGSAGFMRDKKRLNVATSRSRHGMYTLVDVAAYRNIRQPNRDNSHLMCYMERSLLNLYEVVVENLTSKYYRGGQVDSKTSETLTI